MPSISLRFRTESERRHRLDQAAEALGRDRNWLINTAIDRYLEMQEYQLARIEKSIEATDAGGRTYTTSEVLEHLKKCANNFEAIR